MPLSTAEKLEMKELMAGAVQEGLSRVGLGADSEEEVKAIRADLAWTRSKRLATEDIARMFRQGVVRLGVLGVAVLVLYALTHPASFAAALLKLVAQDQITK